MANPVPRIYKRWHQDGFVRTLDDLNKGNCLCEGDGAGPSYRRGAGRLVNEPDLQWAMWPAAKQVTRSYTSTVLSLHLPKKSVSSPKSMLLTSNPNTIQVVQYTHKKKKKKYKINRMRG